MSKFANNKFLGGGNLPVLSGSLDFVNGSNSFLLVPNSTDFAVGTGDFTIEWWQKADSVLQYMRIFSIGAYSSGISIGVAGQSGNLYFWINSSPNGVGSSLGTHGTLTGWHHFVFVRKSGNVKIYKDGVNLSGAGISNSNNASYNASQYFCIGSETTDGTASTIPGSVEFDGKITNFRFIKGEALYSQNFKVPKIALTKNKNTKLLINASRSSSYLSDSALNKSIAKIGTVNWSSETPI